MKTLKRPVSISLGKRDEIKLDQLADAYETSRSETVRDLIRSKRLPKRNDQSLTGPQEAA